MFSAFNPSKCTHLEQWAADCAAPGEQSWTSKSHSVGGGRAPKRTSFWIPPLGSQPLLHLLAGLKLASSKSMNSFHQLPALSPSKNACTVGKTNTDNSDIEFYLFIFYSSSYLNILSPL